jgi:ABC-type glutathione transport system ATPase component
MESKNEIVVVENVEKRYQQQGITPPALHNTSLSIAKSEFLAFIGGSGTLKVRMSFYYINQKQTIKRCMKRQR